VTAASVLRLLECQHYCCALTGRPLTPDTASLDHIVPVCCGGQHVIENTQVLHRDVNRAKTTMTNGKFISLCREVVAHVGRHPEAAQPTE
jgi:5-methylcytosine-specific restriction endonuclease McrA